MRAAVLVLFPPATWKELAQFSSAFLQRQSGGVGRGPWLRVIVGLDRNTASCRFVLSSRHGASITTLDLFSAKGVELQVIEGIITKKYHYSRHTHTARARVNHRKYNRPDQGCDHYFRYTAHAGSARANQRRHNRHTRAHTAIAIDDKQPRVHAQENLVVTV